MTYWVSLYFSKSFRILPSHLCLDHSLTNSWQPFEIRSWKGLERGIMRSKKALIFCPPRGGEKTETEKIHFGLGTSRISFRDPKIWAGDGDYGLVRIPKYGSNSFLEIEDVPIHRLLREDSSKLTWLQISVRQQMLFAFFSQGSSTTFISEQGHFGF